MIRVENVSKYFNVPKGKFLMFPLWEKREVLKGISFKIKEGEFVGLLGPNGSGKTTTIKIMAGILVPEKGKVDVLGYVPWKKEEEYLKKIGVLFGNRSNLMFDVPVIDSLLLFKEIYELDKEFFDKRVEELARMLEIKDILQTPVRKLSFGQRMRAEILACFLHKPKVVFLDEPTIGLDVIASKKVREFLKKINRNEKTTIILTTHNMRDVERLCKRTLLIKDGKIIFDGSTNKLIKKLIKYKYAKVEFNSIRNKSYEKKILESYEVEKCNNSLVGRIPYKEQVKFTELIFKAYDVKAFSLEDQSLEELIEEVFE